MKRNVRIAAIAALSAAVAGAAYAAIPKENDALAASAARIGLAQAIAAAEAHAGGKATRAEFERHHGHPVYDVEVVAGAKVLDVKIDPDTGKVVAATEDRVDGDDARDAED